MIRPTRGYVLILPEPPEERTKSGLFVPDNAQEKPQKGTVLAVGMPPLEYYQTAIAEPTIFKKGDKVYYKRWGGTDIKEDGKEYVIVEFKDILAVVE